MKKKTKDTLTVMVLFIAVIFVGVMAYDSIKNIGETSTDIEKSELVGILVELRSGDILKINEELFLVNINTIDKSGGGTIVLSNPYTKKIRSVVVDELVGKQIVFYRGMTKNRIIVSSQS